MAGHFKIANYLQINYVAGSGEIAVFCGAMAGAGLGFLWFNSYPAQIFMGDVGSLALGAAIGTVAVITKQEIVLQDTGRIRDVRSFDDGYLYVVYDKPGKVVRLVPAE